MLRAIAKFIIIVTAVVLGVGFLAYNIFVALPDGDFRGLILVGVGALIFSLMRLARRDKARKFSIGHVDERERTTTL